MFTVEETRKTHMPESFSKEDLTKTEVTIKKIMLQVRNANINELPLPEVISPSDSKKTCCSL